MLPKGNRLTKRDFTALKGQKARNYSSPLLSLSVFPATKMKFGFVVPGALGPAVSRNTLKRRARALVHELLPFFIGEKTQLILYFKKPALQGPTASLRETVKNLFLRAGLVKGKAL